MYFREMDFLLVQFADWLIRLLYNLLIGWFGCIALRSLISGI